MVQCPVRFWKVVAAADAGGKLFATACVLDRSAVIMQGGTKEAGKIPFGAYKTLHVPIAEVERQTGLTFWSGPTDAAIPPGNLDLLPKSPSRGRRARVRDEESRGIDVPDGYQMFESLDSIYLGE